MNAKPKKQKSTTQYTPQRALNISNMTSGALIALPAVRSASTFTKSKQAATKYQRELSSSVQTKIGPLVSGDMLYGGTEVKSLPLGLTLLQYRRVHAKKQEIMQSLTGKLANHPIVGHRDYRDPLDSLAAEAQELGMYTGILLPD